MEIQKAHWESSEGRVSLHTPILKVNEERREVSGFASLDNEDRQGDIVLKSASVEAFSEFRGNIREMHQPIAVGKMIDFTEDTFIDPDTGEVYSGIWVTVRVSKGAQDTWEKVLDGTLSGFSIGGSVLDAESQVLKSEDGKYKQVNVIKKYRLTELSLVDSPANQFANVFSIAKVDGGEKATGMVAETTVKNIFYCEKDEIAKSAPSETATCLVCETDMQVVGWLEGDGADNVTKMTDLIKRFKGGVDNMEKNDEVEVKEEVVETDAVTTDDVKVDETAGAEEETDETPEEEEEVEKSDAVTVEEVNTDSLEDALRALTDRVDGLSKDDSVAKALEEIKEAVTGVRKDVDGLKDRDVELRKSFDDLKKDLSDIQGRVEKFDSGTALKKSVSNGDTAATEGSSSLWAGSPMSF